MIRTQIRLDTMQSINKFVEVIGRLDEQVWLEDDNGSRVNAKSLLGCLYSMEWARIYCYCKKDINAYIMPWIV